MAKLIKKSKCEFEYGNIVKGNEQVGIPRVVWYQINKLELMLQQYNYLKAQPKYQAGPSLEGFVRESIVENDRPYVSMPDTPTIDKRVSEALAFIEETDKVNDAAKVNELIDNFGPLVDWCAKDKFVEGDCYDIIDTPVLGNPLFLEPEAIAAVLSLIVTSPIEIEE